MSTKRQGPTASSRAERGRWTSARKTEVVLRLLRGEDLETLSRETGLTAARLVAWRDQFLAGGQATLKSRPADGRDDEIRRLKAKVGDLTMDNELLHEMVDRYQQITGSKSPFADRRSKR